jgi:acetylornithine deacetylase/succinyl-diaminopimelate desuccinylase
MSVTVKLSDLVDAMETFGHEKHHYLNLQSGEVHSITEEEFRAAEGDTPLENYPDWQRPKIVVAKEILRTKHFLSLPERFEINEYRMMEDFCLALSDQQLRDAMTYAIQGQGAFRRFKDRLHHYGIAEKWYEYREERYFEIAAQWCEANEIAYVKGRNTSAKRAKQAAPQPAPAPVAAPMKLPRSAKAERTLEALNRVLPRLGLVELLSELVQAPSHPGVPRQEEQAVHALARYFERHQIAHELTEVREGRPNLMANVRSEVAGKRLLLCGHTDTVAPNAITAMKPFAAEVREDRMYGRGTADMKGGLAAMAATLVALKEAQLLARGEVALAAVIDEEMESLGAEALIRSGFKAEGAIIGEPTNNRVASGHKGLEWLEVEFLGKASHGATPEHGCNAVSAAARFIRAVEKDLVPRFYRRRHPIIGAPSINFGTIHGGDQPSTVAAACVVQLDRRWVPSESVDLVFAELEDLLNHLRRAMPGLRTQVRRVPGGMATMVHGPLETASDHPLVRAAQSAWQDFYQKPGELAAFPAWTDAALFSREAKVPSIVLGPGELGLAHSAEESIALAEVEDAVRLYALMAANFLEER